MQSKAELHMAVGPQAVLVNCAYPSTPAFTETPTHCLSDIHRCTAPVQRFVMQPEMPVETALRVYRRYLKLEPSHTEEYVAYLKSKV